MILLSLFFLLFLDSKCVSWRQTGNCNPDGPRKKRYDKTCSTKIKAKQSGYCECGGGSKTMKKGCEKGDYSTCNEACAAGKRDKNNIVYVL